MTAAVDCRLPAVVGAHLRVPLVTGGDASYANLDLAASAPALEDVAAHVTRLLPYYSSVHRGAGYASQVCTGGAGGGARHGRRVPRRAARRRRRVQPQHHRRAEPPGGRRARRRRVPGRRAPRQPAAVALPSVGDRAADRRGHARRARGRAARPARRAGGGDGRVERHRRGAADHHDRGHRARGGRAGGARRGPARPAPPRRHRRVGRRLRRGVRAQALRPVRRGGARRAPRLARRRSPAPGGRRRGHRGAATTRRGGRRPRTGTKAALPT